MEATEVASFDPNALFLKRVAARGDASSPSAVAVSPDGTTTVDGVVVRGAVDPSGRIAPLVTPVRAAALQSGEYFVLGDNVEGSIDSRCWGTVAQTDIAGRPLFRVLPPSRFGTIGANPGMAPVEPEAR